MTFAQSLTTCSKKRRDYKGRASRSEFWWYYLFYLLIQVAVTAYGMLAHNEDLANMISVGVGAAFLLPITAAGARRLHDTGRSGHWQWLYLGAFTVLLDPPLNLLWIVGFIPLVYWWARPGTEGPNKYGDPAAA